MANFLTKKYDKLLPNDRFPSIKKNSLKILTIVGARPQFVKAAAVSRAFSKHGDIRELILHTGQHYDHNMSAVFFEEMKIPKPHLNLNIAGLGHGAMTGRMLEGIEKELLRIKPDWVLVYGDTNSTLAGALAAQKLHIKVVHIEAGIRSFNMKMPEEINRILTDRCSSLLCCPTDIALTNLKKEGYDHFNSKVVKTGDVMQDVTMYYSQFAQKPNFSVPDKFILATIHRAENTNDLAKLKKICEEISILNKSIPVVLPIHPRTKSILEREGIDLDCTIVDPVGYLEMIFLLKNCRLVLTDSGGLQKEAYFFEKPCVTVRDETEWTELLTINANVLCRISEESLIEKCRQMLQVNITGDEKLFGGGKAADKVAREILRY